MATAKKSAAKTVAKKPATRKNAVARKVAEASASRAAGVTATGEPMTWQQMLESGFTIAESVVPLLGPTAVIAASAARAIISAIMAAADQGRDVTDAELDVLFAADARARIEGQVLRAKIEAEAGSATGGA